MESAGIEQRLSRAETAVEAGEGLSGTGFWGVVSEVKRSPELVDRYADRIAAVDRRAHRNWALLVLPLSLGTSLALLVTIAGLALVAWAYALSGAAASVVFLIGVGVVIGATHSLGHLVVGLIVGIRFDYWFVGEPRQPQPGVKVDYSTYLRVAPARRAWMHAAGAITTKALPFLFVGAAVAADMPGWVVAALLLAGAAMVLTDVLWSTHSSDWKKFKREMAYAQDR